MGDDVIFSTASKHAIRASLAATLLLSCSAAALHAETSDKDEKIRRLEAGMAQMMREIRELKSSVKTTQSESRHTRKVVEERGAQPFPAVAAVPANAVPTFVTADKKFVFGALTITPGGFAAAEGVYHSRTEQVDIGSGYQNIPFGPQAGTQELRFSARQSRIAALIEAPITPTVLASGYGEFDFLGSGATSNFNESNSFVPRIRHLYATLDLNEYGLHVLGGQTWSLATLNSKGITPRNEITPPTIDAQYVPGFVWKRQPGIRLTKDFNQKLWFAISAEQPQTTYGGSVGCTAGVNGTAVPNTLGVADSVTCQLGGNNNLNGTAVSNFSLNHVPDVVGKVAYEAKLADRDVHLEAFGLYRDLYDRVAYGAAAAPTSASNQDTTGYGVGGGIIVPIIPKRLDFQASGMYGRGIGSYGTAQFSDATFQPNGAPAAIRESMLLGGLTLHATSAIDLYAFGGVEQVQPSVYTTNAAGTTYAGYGIPTANNSGCFNTLGGGTCNGQAKRVFQITGGMWDKIYKGSFGEVRVGVQYSYTQRELFQGSATSAPATGALPFSPHQNDQSVLTSLRYYPFQ